MKHHLPKTIMVGLSLLLCLYLVMPIFQVVQDTRAEQSDATAAQVAPGDVDSQLAGMSDEQVRQAYSEKLKQDAAVQDQTGQSEDESSWVFITTKFYGAAQAVAAVLMRVGSFFTDEGPGHARWSIAVTKLSDGQGVPYLLATAAGDFSNTGRPADDIDHSRCPDPGGQQMTGSGIVPHGRGMPGIPPRSLVWHGV